MRPSAGFVDPNAKSYRPAWVCWTHDEMDIACAKAVRAAPAGLVQSGGLPVEVQFPECAHWLSLNRGGVL